MLGLVYLRVDDWVAQVVLLLNPLAILEYFWALVRLLLFALYCKTFALFDMAILLVSDKDNSIQEFWTLDQSLGGWGT